MWKILIEETSSLSSRTMLQLTELVTPWSFFSQYTRFHLTVAVAAQQPRPKYRGRGL